MGMISTGSRLSAHSARLRWMSRSGAEIGQLGAERRHLGRVLRLDRQTLAARGQHALVGASQMLVSILSHAVKLALHFADIEHGFIGGYGKHGILLGVGHGDEASTMPASSTRRPRRTRAPLPRGLTPQAKS
jgi:hypothetical protein